MIPLVVTPGDPAGVGPEVTARALAGFHRPVVVVGAADALERWADVERVERLRPVPGKLAVLDPGDEPEPVEVASLRIAVRACLDGDAAGLVTGPIHKARLAARGFQHPGHTEFLGELCGVERPVMAFVGGRVRVALVTVHAPLRDVPGLVTTEGVVHTVHAADHALRAHLGLPRPRIAVCGLNPHAGDEGLLGSEDAEIIAPAVAECRVAGIDARGPVSAEGAFRSAVLDDVDLVVAMYHDQGLAPLKALVWSTGEKSVNWTLGLPIVRTSVDHGTAYDIAGQGIADPGSMRAALALAVRLTREP